MYADYDIRTCTSEREWVVCDGGSLHRETCPTGGRCITRPPGFDDVCVPPPGTGEPCGEYSWIDIYTCNRSRTQRVICADGRLIREPCAHGCITRPTGTDDECAP